MSDNPEASTSADFQLLEYKDGQLQIVEVEPFERNEQQLSDVEPESILPDISGSNHKLMQVFDEKGLVHLDLLNLTLVRCSDNEEAYRLVEAESDGEANDAIACVLQASDGEENESGEYIMMGDEQVPLVFLTQNSEESETDTNNVNSDFNYSESDTRSGNVNSDTVQKDVKEDSSSNGGKKLLTPTEILEKVKAFQKSSLLPPPMPLSLSSGRGRKRKALPPPRQLLASPDLKLFLYSCKRCNFKCNAVKELTEHRLTEHNPKPRYNYRSPTDLNLQCSQCSFKCQMSTQLISHTKQLHTKVGIEKQRGEENRLDLQCSVNVFVCGACGFESISSLVFNKHFQDVHGTTLQS